MKIITVDGPSGAGKGTICQLLAQQLGWHLLDSGAIYRLCALACLNAKVDLNDEPAVLAQAEQLDIAFKIGQQGVEAYLNGQPVSQQLRTEAVAAVASQVAAMPQVREALKERQRQCAQPPGLVADGRDMGSVIFPQADLKIYLTASAQERANRRYKQLQEAGETVNLANILKDIEARDDRDMNRSTAPLKAAEDAIIIDSSDKDITAVLAEIQSLIKQRFLA